MMVPKPFAVSLLILGLFCIFPNLPPAQTMKSVTLASQNILILEKYYVLLYKRKDLIITFGNGPEIMNTMKQDDATGFGEGTIQCLSRMKKKTTVKEMIVLFGTTAQVTSQLKGLRTTNYMATFGTIKAGYAKMVSLKKQLLMGSGSACMGKNRAKDMIIGHMKQTMMAFI